MHCTHCGTPHADDAAVCAQCQQPIQRFPALPALQNYLVPAIVLSLCCCPPFGLIALIFSAQVNSRLAAGDGAGAQTASRRARILTIIGFIAAVLVWGGGAALLMLND